MRAIFSCERAVRKFLKDNIPPDKFSEYSIFVAHEVPLKLFWDPDDVKEKESK